MSRGAWAGFGAVTTLWGIPYLFIRIAVDDGVSPVFLAWARVAIAAVVLLALAWRAGVLRTLRGRWRWVAAYAVAEIAIPFPLIGFGEQRVSRGALRGAGRRRGPLKRNRSGLDARAVMGRASPS